MSKPTIFEELREEVEYEKGRSPFFYRRAFRRLAEKYRKKPDHLILDERLDSQDAQIKQDKNVLRRYPKQGHIYMFEYDPPTNEDIKIFDPFPLVYVINFDGTSFTGSNLHLIHPVKRSLVIENLRNDKVTLPYNSITKYIVNRVNGFMLDIAFEEWGIASNLPIESLISITNGEKRDLKLTDVWKEKNKTFRKMLKGNRIYKSYGKNDADFKGS